MNDQTRRPVTLDDLGRLAIAAFSAVIAARRLLVRVAVASGIAGLVIALGSTSEYRAATKLLPYRSASAATSLSSLAGIAGLRLPQSLLDQAIQPELYPDVANTLDFRVAVAEVPLRFRSLPQLVTTAGYFDSVYVRSPVETALRYTVGLPRVLQRLVRRALESDRETGVSLSGIQAYSADYLEIIEELEDRVTVSISRKTGVISIRAEMPDPVAAADLVQVVSRTLMTRIIEYESKKAADEVKFIELQQERARLRLEAAQDALARFMDANRAELSPRLQVDADRLRSEQNFAFGVYQQLSTELEQARLKMSQDTPVFAVLEAPSVPPKRHSPRRALVLIGTILVGLILAGAWVAIEPWWRSLNRVPSSATS